MRALTHRPEPDDAPFRRPHAALTGANAENLGKDLGHMRDRGYSGTPLPKKLGLKPELAAFFVNLPDDLTHLVDDLPLARCVGDIAEADGRELDYIHVFETDRARLEDHALRLKSMLKPAGMLWLSWPKKASKVPTSITEDVLRTIYLPTGLVDVKVCAVDEVWSGLKFVLRKDLRP